LAGLLAILTGFHGFTQSVLANAGTVPQNMPQLLPSKFIYHSWLFLPLTCSWKSVNKLPKNWLKITNTSIRRQYYSGARKMGPVLTAGLEV